MMKREAQDQNSSVKQINTDGSSKKEFVKNKRLINYIKCS